MVYGDFKHIVFIFFYYYYSYFRPRQNGRRVLRLHGGGQDGVPPTSKEQRCEKYRNGGAGLCRADPPRWYQSRRRLRYPPGQAERRPGAHKKIYI